MADPSDRNTSVKAVEKLSKYKDLYKRLKSRECGKWKQRRYQLLLVHLRSLKGLEKYRKIPKIIPGAYIFQRPFLRGLFLGGLYSERLIYGGKFAFQNRLG